MAHNKIPMKGNFMNNKTAAVIATVAVVGVATIATVATWENYIKQIQERFPELEIKLIRKTYRKLMLNSFRGKYGGDLSNMTDQQMDELFLSLYKKQATSK